MRKTAILYTLMALLLTVACSTHYPAGTMEYPERAQTQRASSYDRNWEWGNTDARPCGVGETITIADLEGPGRVTHIWFTIAAWERLYTRKAVLRVYYDGSDVPAVEAPLGDFFAIGHGKLETVESEMVTVTSRGRAYNCYWPMPFRESLRMTLTNEGTEPILAFFSYVDWEQREVPEDVPYFHAQYHQENPPEPGRDYLIFDGEGKGHYVGTVMSVRMSQHGWFGEGDDRFYIDGATTPTLHGTGTEDYFCDAWAYRQFDAPYYGVPIWEGQQPGDRGTMYRWHVYDPVFFDESLKVMIEHKGNTFDEDVQLIDAYTEQRPDFYSSVAFWYQTGEAKRFAELPPAEERVPEAIVLNLAEYFEDMGEEKPAFVNVVDSGLPQGPRLAFLVSTPPEQNEMIVKFQLEEKGWYALFARIWQRAETGIYDVYIDGLQVVEDYDVFATNGPIFDLKLGHGLLLEPGEHTVRFVPKGKNLESVGGHLFLTDLVIEPIRYTR